MKRKIKEILYPNCSELVADFNIHDSESFYPMMKEMGRKHKWMFDPPLSLRVLEEMVRASEEGWDEKPTIKVVDTKGRTTTIEYGPNGYDDELGFRLDSGCDDYDSSQYDFFQKALGNCNTEMRVYDGGNLEGFETWQKKHGKI